MKTRLASRSLLEAARRDSRGRLVFMRWVLSLSAQGAAEQTACNMHTIFTGAANVIDGLGVAGKRLVERAGVDGVHRAALEVLLRVLERVRGGGHRGHAEAHVGERAGRS